MKNLSIDELIDHCNRQLDRLPSGTNGYQEHESVRAYLQELRHFRSLGVPFDKLRDLVEECGEGKFYRVDAEVGDTIWRVDYPGTVMPYLVCKIDITDHSRGYHCFGELGDLQFADTAIGRYVFLTKSEAEEYIKKWKEDA